MKNDTNSAGAVMLRFMKFSTLVASFGLRVERHELLTGAVMIQLMRFLTQLASFTRNSSQLKGKCDVSSFFGIYLVRIALKGNDSVI